MSLRTSDDPYLRYNRAGFDNIGAGHGRHTIRAEFEPRATSLIRAIGVLPYRGIITGAQAQVEVADNGTTPTVKVGTYDGQNAEIDDDNILVTGDIDLTSTGWTPVTNKAGYIAASDNEVIVAEYAAAAAATAGKFVLLIDIVNPLSD